MVGRVVGRLKWGLKGSRRLRELNEPGGRQEAAGPGHNPSATTAKQSEAEGPERPRCRAGWREGCGGPGAPKGLRKRQLSAKNVLRAG